MAVKRIIASMDVVAAARNRIKNVFSNNVPVYMSFSGGKDSLVMADITLKLIKAGEINPQLLTVIFIDEEAIYTSVEEKVQEWRKKFIMAGASFDWWCVEVKHFSAYNQLTADESYTCWDHTKEDAWVRRPPPFALRNHPQLKPGIDNYQSFLPKVTGDGIMLVGVRASESVQRLQYMAALNLGAGSSITGKNMIYPMYDWTTKDVWLYLKNENVDIPIIYLWLYQAGINRNQLRISQFFSVDCVGSLIHIAKYEPGLWEKILRREPNAYLAALYWDSELYRRTSKQRREAEKDKDYKSIVKHMLFENPNKYFTTELTRKVATQYRKLIIKMDNMIQERDYRKIHDALVAGDPKLRTLRAISVDIFSSYAKYAKNFRKGGEQDV
ncbi:MAG: phosphoadenosine phosphosulfate reductase family protein [Sedimentibacter sp.]